MASQKSRQSILEAFKVLVLHSHGLEIRVSDIIREADIGRSTFYEHFPNAESVLQQAVVEPFRVFARATLEEDVQRILGMLRHFADNRIPAMSMMSDAKTRDLMSNVLAEQYNSLLALKIADSQLRSLCSVQLAEANLAMTRQWISGQLNFEDATIAAFILSCTKQVVAIFD